METTKERLSRVNKGLLYSLELCEKEIRDCHSQKSVREDALRKNVVDNQDLIDQISKYKEIVDHLKYKNENAKTRRTKSQEEVEKLKTAIKICTNASKDVEEIKSLVDNYKASMDHHTDIVKIASLELEGDQQQLKDIQQSILLLDEELKKAQRSLEFPDAKQYQTEIGQLDDAIDLFTEDRAEILAVLDELDVDRLKNGNSKLITLSAKKKRKLDSDVGFSPESRSPRVTKRARPAEMDNALALRKTDNDQENIDRLMNAPALDISTLFTLFLPTSAQVLSGTGVSESCFDEIKWLNPVFRIPFDQDLERTGMFGKTWKGLQVSEENTFALQSCDSLFSTSYRIVAIDPYSTARDIALKVNDPTNRKPKEVTYVVPLATTNDSKQASLFFRVMASLEEYNNFDYPAVWRVLCKSK
jgi:hypothetical protein